MNEEIGAVQAIVDRALAGKTAVTVLEAGSGSATHLAFPPDTRLVGIDISERQLERNAALDEKIVGDIQSYDLPTNTFEIVVCWQVLEHLPHPERALVRMVAALKEDGLLVLSLPNVLSLKGLITKLTPHSFHVWVYRRLLGRRDAGKDDTAPFPTFLRLDMRPAGIRRFALENGLGVDHFDAFESYFQTRLRRRLRVQGRVWRFARGLVRAVTFGLLEAENTELVVVLRKAAWRNEPPQNGRPRVAVLAWSRVEGRARDLAASLHGEARTFYSLGIIRRELVPLRYALNAVRSLAFLARRRPRAVVVSNPPVFAGLLALAYGKFARAPVALDSHPGSFGLNGSEPGRIFLPVHRWMVRRSPLTLVVGDDLAKQVERWGGRPLVVHEAPPTWSVAPLGPLPLRPSVLIAGQLAPDEPVVEAVAAARLVPELDLVVTGDLRRAPGLQASAPENVSFVGFLPDADYVRALELAQVVLVLSVNPSAIMRAACEAVYAGRILVASDSPYRRKVFPWAVHVENDAASIAAGLRSAVGRYDELVSATRDARARLLEAWRVQHDALEATLAAGAAR